MLFELNFRTLQGVANLHCHFRQGVRTKQTSDLQDITAAKISKHLS